MLAELKDIAPKGVVTAVALWAGASYFLIGPETATRIANADYVAACTRDLAANIDAQVNAASAQIDIPNEDQIKGELAAKYLDRMRGQYSEHMGMLNMLTGGAFDMAREIQHETARRANEARENARRVIEAQRQAAIAAAPDQCSCQVVSALNESRVEWAIYTATFGLIEQEKVSSFPLLMKSHGRACAARN